MIYWNDEDRKESMKSFVTFISRKPRICKDGKWQCYLCEGSGRIIHPDEVPDPCEGYKMARRINCTQCNGSGDSNEKYWRNYFKEEKKRYLEKQQEEKSIEETRKTALKKLTDEEKRALGLI